MLCSHQGGETGTLVLCTYLYNRRERPVELVKTQSQCAGGKDQPGTASA